MQYGISMIQLIVIRTRNHVTRLQIIVYDAIAVRHQRGSEHRGV